MANRTLFSSQQKVYKTDTVNNAGGASFSLSSEAALAQYAVTSCLNDTFYVTAEAQLGTILDLASKSSPEFVAKCAVYAKEQGKMKDTPVLLLAHLCNRGEAAHEYIKKIFNRVINNVGALRNFVQIIRSGTTGRKSFGTLPRKLICEWLENHKSETLFRQSIGQNPSLADVVKMTHPKPESEEKEAFYGWLLNKRHEYDYLPSIVKDFERFKSGSRTSTAGIPFRMLTTLNLTTDHWKQLALSESWDTIRQNLNTFNRHGVFEDEEVVNYVAKIIKNPDNVRKFNVFPYQLLTTFLNTDGVVPVKITNALQDAMEVACENVPTFNGKVVVCVDVSGSMNDPVTGHIAGATSKTKCVDVAALMASCILRKNPEALIVPFDTKIRVGVHLNSRDSVMTNAKKLSISGGGTTCEEAIAHLNRNNWQNKPYKPDLVVMISDNESWFGKPKYRNNGTGMVEQWNILKKRCPKAKLVCWDIQVADSTQILDNNSVMNVGGWVGDTIFELVDKFVNQKEQVSFVKDVESVKI